MTTGDIPCKVCGSYNCSGHQNSKIFCRSCGYHAYDCICSILVLNNYAQFEVIKDYKAFGYSYLLDMYNCKPGVCDDMEVNYRFLEQLVHKIDMTPMTLPFIIHGPRDKYGTELFPDKAGISGFVPLIESGIAIHTLEPSRFITLDVYSCKFFDKEIVKDFAKECFGFESYEENFITRGKRYKND